LLISDKYNRTSTLSENLAKPWKLRRAVAPYSYGIDSSW
jgi:hypothetical protein